MDIQISSNFERALLDAYDRDGAAVADLMDGLKTDNGFSLSQGIIDRLRQYFLRVPFQNRKRWIAFAKRCKHRRNSVPAFCNRCPCGWAAAK